MKNLRHFAARLIKARARKVSCALRRACRLLSGKPRSLPDFIIIGAQKSGTTSLYSFLTQHPQVFRALQKEVHFFNQHYEKGPRWYRAHFPPTKELPPGSITGEATPRYISNPLVPKRICELVPDVKLVAILRDPAERAVSNYFQGVRAGWERRPILEALSADEALIDRAALGWNELAIMKRQYKSRGLYFEQLERYLRYFSREQLLILKSEAFFNDPHETLAAAFDFLGVDPGFKVMDLRPRNVTKNRTEVAPEVYEYLSDYYRSPNEALYELLGKDFGW
jgi:hypothetical protein